MSVDDLTQVVRVCSRCGRALPADAPGGLCAACLFEMGVETMTRDVVAADVTMAAPAGGAAASAEGLQRGLDDQQLEPGQTWGNYRIGRLLGRGGMGEVYQAEHIVSGRRVALKVLRRQLQDPSERARFLREGQLAASVSHPHTVYIYGSEEIDRLPVITMELLPGGTLKDRVAERGPLPPAEAVAAILDIVGGLDAAQAAGILHRDIKPSNCFMDHDGSVKVGDFGLSISTLARDVRHELDTAGFQGTPQFAPPEQLRGEPLDVRADIYAVGATLYYLLTAQAPFDGRDLRELFARVSNEPPKSPRTLRPAVPAGLATVVLRCLAKTPAERPATYAALAEALRPFLAQQDAPANPGLRLMAGVLDSLILGALFGVWQLSTLDLLPGATQRPNGVTWWSVALGAAYFLTFESLWGASIGKRLFGLRVAAQGTTSRANRTSLIGRIAIRTTGYLMPDLVTVTLTTVMNSPMILTWGAPQGQPGGRFTLDIGSGLPLFLTAVLFSTARRRNGWMGLHEWLSATRVVARVSTNLQRQRRDAEPVLPALHQSAKVAFGPFAVLSDLGDTGTGHLFLGFDPALRRQVWVHQVPPGTPPASAARRDVSRIGRLHWLTGMRTPADASAASNWDAFEAPAGEPLISDRRSHDWPSTKVWLVDLASELLAAEKDGSMPALGLERLWLRADGHLVLLDFPAPQAATASRSTPASLTPVGLLAAVGTRALDQHGPADENAALAMPLSARRLIQEWSSSHPATLADAHRAIMEVAAAPDRVSRIRRAMPIGLAALPAVVMSVASLLLIPALDRFFGSDASEMMEWLALISKPAADSRLADASMQREAEVYVAGRFAARLRDENFWRALDTQPDNDIAVRHRLARTLVERYPAVAPADLQRATATLAPEIAAMTSKIDGQSFAPEVAPIIAATLAAFGVGAATLFSLLSSLIVPGGIVTRMLGHAVVTRAGAEIGRVRSFARVAVAWLPALVWFVVLLMSKKMQGFVPNPQHPLLLAALAIGALAAGAAWTIARPARGPHDRVAGTWVVPR